MATHPSPQKWITEWLSKQELDTPFLLERLLGDGSSRIFYRLHLKDEQYIVIEDPKWIQSKDYPAHQKFLIQLGFPVPHFLQVDPEAGFLLMEDFGDELLQHRIVKNPAEKKKWLIAATELLADLHGKTFPVEKTLPVASRRFDEAKYFEEFQFTLEHLHKLFLGLPDLDAKKLTQLKSFCGKIAAFSPDVFCHRDYHTRNLLLSEEALRLIDFQDARMGSPQYDLASLLYDAYVPVSFEDRKALLDVYRKRIASFPVDKSIDWNVFEERLSWVAFQRTVKAAGSFASFFTRFKKDTHLPYLVPALSSALDLQKTCASLQREVESIFDISQWIEKIAKRA